MAKKKATSEAKRAKKKAAKKKAAAREAASAVFEAPNAERPVAEPSGPDVPAAEASRDQELHEGALATRITAEVLAGLQAEMERNIRTAFQSVLDSITPRLTAMENRFIEAPRVLATKDDAATGEPERLSAATAEAIVSARRETTWLAELNQQSPLRLPRPTIIGRAIGELESRSRAVPTAREVFLHIQERGVHHLPRTITRLLARSGSRPASTLRKHFKTRCSRLVNARLAKPLERGYRLMAIGKSLFKAWPDWGVADDDAECDGRLQNVTPPEEPSGASDGATTTAVATPRTTGAALAEASGGVSASGQPGS
jgi:hypothetical protein